MGCIGSSNDQCSVQPCSVAGARSKSGVHAVKGCGYFCQDVTVQVSSKILLLVKIDKIRVMAESLSLPKTYVEGFQEFMHALISPPVEWLVCFVLFFPL